MSSERIGCVTGSTGFLGSHVVKSLLERGWSVRALVRSDPDSPKVAHLKALPHQERLTIVKVDLMSETPEAAKTLQQSFDGADTCFHVASPFFNRPKGDNPEEELVTPAITMTRNVFKACAVVESIVDVILTSSTASVQVRGPDGEGRRMGEGGRVIEEENWSDEEFMRKMCLWYPLGKTMAEKWAWSYVGGGGEGDGGKGEEGAEGKGKFRLVVMNPTLITGPVLQPGMNTSTEVLLEFCVGEKKRVPSGGMTWVDVRDVAVAHVLAAENKEAKGRYLLITELYPWTSAMKVLTSSLPTDLSTSLPTTSLPSSEEAPDRYNIKYDIKFSQKKALELGVKFTPIGDSMRDVVQGEEFLCHLRNGLKKE